MTSRLLTKLRTTVPNVNPQRVALRAAILVSLLSFQLTAVAPAQSIATQPATWTKSSTNQQSSFREVAATVAPAAANGLSWGTTAQQKPKAKPGHSAFSEIRTVSAVEPLRLSSEEQPPKLFLGEPLEESQQSIVDHDHARQVALMRVTTAKPDSSPRYVIPVAATEDPHATPFVAGRIPLSNDPFGDKVAPFTSRSADPHLDPFGENEASSSSSAAPSITLSPDPITPDPITLSPITPSPVTSSPVKARTPAPALSSPITPTLSPQLPAAVEPQIEHAIQQPELKQMFDFNSKRRVRVRPPLPQRNLSQAESALDVPPSNPNLPNKVDPFLKDDAADVPEFPEYRDRREKLTTPKGAGDSGDLPEVKEPPRPGGERDDAENDDKEEDGLLEFPNEDEPRRDQEDDEDGDLDGDLDEDDEDGEEDDDGKKSPRCDRVHNDRNCCEQDTFCRDTAKKLREASIRDVDVSITPPLVPLAEDETEIEEQQERLLKSPVRSWMNRQGGLIATGRLADFKDEAIIVETIEGGRVSIPYYQVGYDDLCFLTAWWRLPGDCLIAGDDRASRSFAASTFTWKASAVCHKPLYFEEVQLERYGHSAGPILQPLLSGAHFISNIQLLPYNMGVYPPTECRYVLGHYRPGSCAPWLIPAFPLSHRGVAYQLGAAFGLWGLF